VNNEMIPCQDDDEELYELFHGRCVRCNVRAVTIHEIIPRSHGKGTMELDNRIPICASCHAWAHDIGTKTSIPVLKQYRIEALERYG
jgi:5-methylcytosine-specific restriction endonuclease McrA